MIELKSPDETRGRIKSRWYYSPKQEAFEVFTLDGVEYVECGSERNADVVVIMTRLNNKRVLLCKWKPVE